MTNSQIASAIDEIGTLLELKGENPFRSNSYHAASRAIDQVTDDIAARVQAGDIGTIPGVGEAIREKIVALVNTGKIPQLEELRAATPPGLLQMLRLPGLGPKKVKVIFEQGIADLEALKSACDAGVIAKMKGFGPKSQTNIMSGLEFLQRVGGRIRIDAADALSAPVVAILKSLKGVQRVEACGSLRRRKETIGDLDFLVSCKDPACVQEAFAALPDVVQVVAKGETLTSVLLPVGSGPTASTIRADLRTVEDAQFPYALHHFTGSKEHNVAMRGRAQQRGFKMNEYDLVGPKGSVKCKTEEDIFRALGLEFIPPELRENTGEVPAAENNAVPKLVEVRDIRGVFHNHTNYSDGINTVAEMAAAAQALGFEYLGLGDHSQSLTVARGLSPERVKQQHQEIDALNKKLNGFRVFKGIECDILTDGSLDYDDEVLASFDYVVASVHTNFGLTRDEMTARIIRAIRHPSVTMLGHATGRLLLQRSGYEVDLDAVLRAAAESGTMIEINAHPKRLELDWIHCKRAKELGITIVINPDAHCTEELALFRYGVDVARRGWLTGDNVFNTRPLSKLTFDKRGSGL